MSVTLNKNNIKNGDIVNETHFKTIDDDMQIIQDTFNNSSSVMTQTDRDNLNKIGDLSTLTTTDKTSLVNAIKENTASLSEMALYGATCSYASNVFTLTLANAPTALPNFYTVRFKAPSVWIEGSTFKIGTKTYTPVNANFNLDDVIILNFDEISGKCFTTGSAKTVLPTNLIYSTTGALTYYVDANNGNDANDGLTSGTAFKTIQNAINKLPQIINHTINIVVANGTYANVITIIGFSGKGNIVIKSNGTTLSDCDNCVINGGFMFVANSIPITVQDIKCVNDVVNTYAVYCDYCSYVIFYMCKFDGANRNSGVTYSQGFLSTTSRIQIQNCDISNYNAPTSQCISAGLLTIIFSNNVSGANNKVGLYANSGGTIIKNSTQPTATTAESTATGGVIR